MDMTTKILATPEDMEREAALFIEELEPETKGATLVTLSGELGAGKTTFTQAVARTLGIKEIVNSPTFVIQKRYAIRVSDRNFSNLIHIDAYRLSGIGELMALGYAEINRFGNLIFIEWPENVPGISDTSSVNITLAVLPDGSRQITYA